MVKIFGRKLSIKNGKISFKRESSGNISISPKATITDTSTGKKVTATKDSSGDINVTSTGGATVTRTGSGTGTVNFTSSGGGGSSSGGSSSSTPRIKVTSVPDDGKDKPMIITSTPTYAGRVESNKPILGDTPAGYISQLPPSQRNMITKVEYQKPSPTIQYFGETRVELPYNFNRLSDKRQSEILKEQGVKNIESYLYSKGLSLRGSPTVDSSGNVRTNYNVWNVGSAGLLLTGTALTESFEFAMDKTSLKGTGGWSWDRVPVFGSKVQGGQSIVANSLPFLAFAPLMPTTTQVYQNLPPPKLDKPVKVEVVGSSQQYGNNVFKSKEFFVTGTKQFGSMQTTTRGYNVFGNKFLVSRTSGRVATTDVSKWPYDLITGQRIAPNTNFGGVSIARITQQQGNRYIFQGGGYSGLGGDYTFFKTGGIVNQGKISTSLAGTNAQNANLFTRSNIYNLQPTSTKSWIIKGKGGRLLPPTTQLTPPATTLNKPTFSSGVESAVTLTPQKVGFSPIATTVTGATGIGKPISTNQVVPIYSYQEMDSQQPVTTIINPSSTQPPIVTSVTRTGSSSETRGTTTTIPRVDQPIIPVQPTPVPTPQTPIFDTPYIPFIAPAFSLGFSSRKRGVGKVGSKPKYGYVPSFTALLGGIRGSERKGSLRGGRYSGFEFRPVTSGFLKMTGFGGNGFKSPFIPKKKKKRGDLF